VRGVNRFRLSGPALPQENRGGNHRAEREELTLPTIESPLLRHTFYPPSLNLDGSSV
jgi:hypothetical protein